MPDKRIWRYQLILIVVSATTLSTLILIFWLPPIIRDYGQISTFEEYQEDIRGTKASTVIFDYLPKVTITLLFLISLVLLSGLLFLWVPSLTDLSGIKGKGKMVWLRTHGVIPERVFSLKNSNAHILIHRKRSSLKGLLMKEFIMEVFLSKDMQEIKQISDFTSIEKITQTPNHNILIKTVNLKQLPLQFIQIKSILASVVKTR